MEVVAEIFGDRHGGVSDKETDSRGFVHLSENHDGLVQNACSLHFPVQFLGLSAPFADSAEQAQPVVFAHNIMDHFGDQDGLADACTTKEACLSAAFQRA